MYGVLGLFLEISNLFVNARWFFFEHGLGDRPVINLINSSLLFISYTIFRVVFHTYISFTIAWPITLEFFVEQSDAAIIKGGHIPWAYRTAGIYMWVTNVLSQFINIYWYTLILK